MLRAHGFSGGADPTGSILIGTMPLARAQSFFGVTITTADEAGAVVAYPASPPSVPPALASVATDVAGLGRTLPPASAPAPAAAASPRAPIACPGLAQAAARRPAVYGVDALRRAGATGQGVTLGVLEVAAVSQASLSAVRDCSGLHLAPVTTTRVGTTQPGDLIDDPTEPTLDVIAAAAMAPGLDGIRAYEFDQYTSIVFPLAAATGDALGGAGPEVVSSSIGVCEPDMTPGEMAIGEWLLASAAAGGVTTVASAGDTGSSACAPASTAQADQYPASSQFVTGVGGTAIDLTAPRPQRQVVWNAQGSAGGGSTASRIPRPWYQQRVSGPPNRIVPDVAVVAAPSDVPPVPLCTPGGCALGEIGGTSGSAPAVAGGAATVLQALRHRRGDDAVRLGLLNPTLYALASTPATARTLWDVTQGTNDLNGVGCCTATRGYDPASGWGSIDFAALAAAYVVNPLARPGTR